MMTVDITPDLDAIERRMKITPTKRGLFDLAADINDLLVFARAQQQRIAELEAALGKFAKTVHKTNAIAAELGHDQQD